MGVRGAMGGRQARQLCPDAIVVTPRFKAYVQASKDVFAIFEDTAPVVEGLSMEEAFLDVRGLERICGLAARGSPSGCGGACASEVGPAAERGRGAHQAPGQGGQPRRPSPTGCWWCRADEEIGVPAPAAGRGAVGGRPRHGGQAARARHPPGRAPGGRARARAGGHAGPRGGLAPERDRATTATRGRCGHAGGGGRWARSRRWAAAPRTQAELDAVLVALVDRVTRRMRSSGPGRADGHAAPALRRLLARVALAQPGPGHGRHRDHAARTVRDLYAEARPLIADRGLTLLGLTFTNLGHVRDGVQLALPLEPGAPPGAGRGGRPGARALRRRSGHPRRRCCAPGARRRRR